MKYVLLSLLLIFLITTESYAAPLQENRIAESDQPSILQDNSCQDMLNTFIYIILTNAGEITSINNHIPSDNKYYIKLFIHPNANKVHIPSFVPADEHPSANTLSELERTVYYIYALQKIIL